MKTKSHYDVLGIHKSASKDDIRRAYIIQARINHPDKNGNSPESTERFQAIQNAYQVLFDDQTRRNYDKWELPEIERKQRDEAQRDARGEAEPEGNRQERQDEHEGQEQEAPEAEENREQSGGFEYEETQEERNFRENRKKKEREKEENARGWNAHEPKDFKVPAPKTKQEIDREKEEEEKERLMKDGTFDVKDSNGNVTDQYTKKGNKFHYTSYVDLDPNKAEVKPLDRRTVEAMIDHAMKVSNPPLKISGGGAFMHMAFQICNDKGIETKNGNLSLPNFFRR